MTQTKQVTLLIAANKRAAEDMPYDELADV